MGGGRGMKGTLCCKIVILLHSESSAEDIYSGFLYQMEKQSWIQRPFDIAAFWPAKINAYLFNKLNLKLDIIFSYAWKIIECVI